MQVSLIRHGKAEYSNIEPTRDRINARDIVPSTLDELKVQAQEFVSRMRPEDTVTIWSSPIPRALETSRVFEEVLVSQGKNIRKTAVFDVFEEARGFKFAYLNVLVNGGIIELAGKKIEVDPLKTNPNSLTLGQYFRESEWTKISPSILETLQEFGGVIQGMESYSDIVNRITNALQKIEKISDKNHHILIFTHQCCTDFVIEEVNDYSKGGINPGQAVTLEIHEMGMRVINTPFGTGNIENILSLTRARAQEKLN